MAGCCPIWYGRRGAVAVQVVGVSSVCSGVGAVLYSSNVARGGACGRCGAWRAIAAHTPHRRGWLSPVLYSSNVAGGSVWREDRRRGGVIGGGGVDLVQAAGRSSHQRGAGWRRWWEKTPTENAATKNAPRKKGNKKRGRRGGEPCLPLFSRQSFGAGAGLFAGAVVVSVGRRESIAGHSFPRGRQNVARHAFPTVSGGGVQILFNLFRDSN